jgi:phage terminase Nu1 subunit (DNA packaging protein)
VNLSRKEFAALLGLTTRQVHNLEAEGLPCHAEGIRKFYPMPDAARWYYDRKLERAKADMAPTDYNEARNREMLARAEMAELDVAKARGRLMDLDDAEELVTRPLANLRAGLLGLPGRIAAELPLPAVDVLDIVEPLVHELMQALSDGDDEDTQEAA